MFYTQMIHIVFIDGHKELPTAIVITSIYIFVDESTPMRYFDSMNSLKSLTKRMTKKVGIPLLLAVRQWLRKSRSFIKYLFILHSVFNSSVFFSCLYFLWNIAAQSISKRGIIITAIYIKRIMAPHICINMGMQFWSCRTCPSTIIAMKKKWKIRLTHQ